MTNNRRIKLATAFGTTLAAVALMGSLNSKALCQTAADELPLKGTLEIPKVVEPAASSLDVSSGQRWHRVNLYLAGSMCPACLLELQDKLHRLPGVAYANIDYKNVAMQSPSSHDSDKTGSARKKAPTIIVYDQSAIHWKTLEHLIVDSHYHCSDLTDKIIAEQNLPTQRQ